MTEPLWPLIPREALPAPVQPARARSSRRPPPDGGRQLAIFGAETADPSPGDLAGLLVGPGRLSRIGGTARVSVRVDAAWRVHVLAAELRARGLVVTWQPDPAGGFDVGTAYSRRLNGLAHAWPDTVARLFLNGPRLRLWVAAAGAPVTEGYALGMAANVEAGEVVAQPGADRLAVIDATLTRAGLGGRLSDTGWHYVISGRRRLNRLAELVGPRPASAPVDIWPAGAGA